MRVIGDEIYGELSDQILQQIEEGELEEGVAEYFGADCQVVMWWEAASMVPMELKRWMVLSFDGGVRCGNDFSLTKFMEIYNLRYANEQY